MKPHVVVLMGGWSSERSVSLTSGAGVVDALAKRGYRVTGLDMERDVAQRLLALRPDVVFNALHGTPGEDGSVQGLLELLNIPYTHSGVGASALAIDKHRTKVFLTAHGIPMPQGKMVTPAELFAADPLPRPYVVKPNAEGSSVGVAIIDDHIETPIAAQSPGPWHTYPSLLAEAFIPGRELTATVLKDRTLAVTELQPVSGFYDFDAKYTEGRTRHLLPAPLPSNITDQIMALALKAHRLLGCTGLSRADFRYDESGPGGVYVLEVNTQPGMTPLSLAPEQAAYVGIDYGTLVEMLIEDAQERFHARQMRGA